MKKLIVALSCLALLAGAGCAKKSAPAAAEAAKTYSVGISKIVVHPALDSTEQGIQDELKAEGISATYDLQCANGDVNTATQIATKFKSEKVDAIVAIATPTAVAAANAVKDIPVVFSVVTDPVSAGLVGPDNMGKGNVTGLSDKLDVLSQLTLFQRVAKIKTLGYIYTSSEANSASSLADLRAACAKLGIKLVEQSIVNSSEVKQATEAIIGRVDGIFLSTDNTVFSALPALVQVAGKAKKPIFSSDTTSAKDGGVLIASGFDYYKAGRATGALVAKILSGTAPASLPVKYITDPAETDLLINLDVAKACGISFPDDIQKAATKVFQNGALTTK